MVDSLRGSTWYSVTADHNLPRKVKSKKSKKSRNNKDFPSKTADDCTCTMTRACYSDTNVPVLISRRRKAEEAEDIDK